MREGGGSGSEVREGGVSEREVREGGGIGSREGGESGSGNDVRKEGVVVGVK